MPDLMDQLRIRAALGDRVTFVRRPLDLTQAGADLVLVDLARDGVIDVLPAITARTIGFGPHVDSELLASAEAAGCNEVMPRSRFFTMLRGLT